MTNPSRPQGDLPHTTPAEAIAANFGVQIANGLTPDSANERLAEFGTNALAVIGPRSPWLLFASQFKNILVVILILAALLAALIGNTKDAIVICMVVILNAAVAFFQEYRAEQSLAALKRMLPMRARVRRQSEKVEIPAEDIVPGDGVLIEAEDRVPADGRLTLSIGLTINESSLTGEPQTVTKDSSMIAADQPHIRAMAESSVTGAGKLPAPLARHDYRLGWNSRILSASRLSFWGAVGLGALLAAFCLGWTQE